MSFKYQFSNFSLSGLQRHIGFGLQWWIWVPLSLAMGLIFSTGPMFQQYIFALITSDETSIYGSSFERQAVTLPKLDDWFENGLSWPHICIGLIVVLLSARSTSVKQMFLRLALFGFATLLFFDLGYALVQGTLSIASTFENLIANFVGGIVAAGIAILILEMADYGFGAFEWPIWVRRSIAGFLVLLGGALALCAIFYITDFFYRPRPASIDLTAGAPSEGFIVANTVERGRNPSSEKGQSTAAFSLLSRVEQSASLNCRAPKHGRIEWSAENDLASYDIEVSLFTGCGPTESNPNRRPNDSSFIVSNARSLSLWHDWGTWDITVAAEKGYGSSRLTGTDTSFFSIDTSSNGKDIDLQQFVAKSSQVKYSGGAGSLDLFMIAPPEKPVEATQVMPSLHFNVDGNEHIMNLRNTASDVSSEKIECLAAPTRQAFEAKVLGMDKGSLLGVRLVISPKSEGQGLPNNVIVLKGDGGWLSSQSIDPQTLNATGEERINMITISGNLKSATINGSDPSPKVGDYFVAVGENQLRGSFVSGLLKVSGTAELLWVNSERANQTKWESLPIEYKAILLGVLGFVSLWVLRRVSILVNKAEELAWLEDGFRQRL